jgi:thiamine-phosphate pyrophosphorylase
MRVSRPMKQSSPRPSPFQGEGEHQALFRVADANLNRCREGLRVLEDTARFFWKDKRFFQKFRVERHRLDRLTRQFYPELIQARNSEQDDGRQILESKREDMDGVIIANFRRCEESLRVLEEYGKLFSRNAGAEFKKARFRIYELEKEISK